MLATEQQVEDLQRQLAQEKARTANLPLNTTATRVETEPTAALGPEADGPDPPAGTDASETSDEEATDGDQPDSGTEGAQGVDEPPWEGGGVTVERGNLPNSNRCSGSRPMAEGKTHTITPPLDRVLP